MKKTLLIFLLALSSYNLISQNKIDLKSAISGVNGWNKVKDVDAAYIINFPNKPEKGNNDVDTDKGVVKMNTYTLQTADGDNLIYMSSFTEYPNSFFPDKLQSEEKQNEVLNNSVKGAVNNTRGTLILDDKITFNGYNGRIIKIEVDEGYIIKMKVLLVGIKLYIAQVIFKKENDDNADAKRFFDSFELINVKNE